MITHRRARESRAVPAGSSNRRVERTTVGPVELVDRGRNGVGPQLRRCRIQFGEARRRPEPMDRHIAVPTEGDTRATTGGQAENECRFVVLGNRFRVRVGWVCRRRIQVRKLHTRGCERRRTQPACLLESSDGFRPPSETRGRTLRCRIPQSFPTFCSSLARMGGLQSVRSLERLGFRCFRHRLTELLPVGELNSERSTGGTLSDVERGSELVAQLQPPLLGCTVDRDREP